MRINDNVVVNPRYIISAWIHFYEGSEYYCNQVQMTDGRIHESKELSKKEAGQSLKEISSLLDRDFKDEIKITHVPYKIPRGEIKEITVSRNCTEHGSIGTIEVGKKEAGSEWIGNALYWWKWGCPHCIEDKLKKLRNKL